MLRQVNGPNPGRVFPLDRRATLIGRLPDNHIVLKPRYISKRHATIERGPDGTFRLIDHSHAGTFVDGQRLTGPLVLKDGQEFQVCNYTFSFHTRLLTIAEEDDNSTIFLSLDSSSPAHGNALEPAQKLRKVMEISRGLARTLNLGELLEGALSSLFQVFPAAQRGFILLREEPDGALVPRAIRSRDGQGKRLAISRTILDRVLKDSQAILTRDARAEFATSDSVSDQSLRSLMCVPLLDVRQKPIGIIQLDIADHDGRFGQDDLDLLIAIGSQVSLAVEHARLHAAAVRQSELEHELIFARQVLQALLPEPRTELAGYELWAYYEPARHVGGDYYGYFPLPSRDDRPGGSAQRWAIAVGDVAGKGMPAALLMAKLSAEVRVALQTESCPAAVVERLNKQLCETGVPDMFVTFLLLVLDPTENEIAVVNAGHLGPLLRRAQGRLEIVRSKAISLPLGVEPSEPFRVVTTRLEPGDRVVLYTDGVVDALNAAGRALGQDQLRQVLQSTPPGAHAVGEAILEAVRRHSTGRPQTDDITLLCLSRPRANSDDPSDPPS